MASPNLSQARVFAVSRSRSRTSQPQQIGLLLQLDSIPYWRCPPPGLGIATVTGTADLTPQLRAAASTIDAENMVHSDSMSPTSPGIWSKLSQKWEIPRPL
ncbi:hypothetical protein AMECASPLE_023853 [Ameca splendens]|uniref:Uncharacterized protein n=1 Tax=Ameca splendens TaxID=208324 RepID=A0ABV0ZDG0_9TELE